MNSSHITTLFAPHKTAPFPKSIQVPKSPALGAEAQAHLCRIRRAIALEQRAAITLMAATVLFAGTIISAMIFAVRLGALL
jgi:hypothetical protein